MYRLISYLSLVGCLGALVYFGPTLIQRGIGANDSMTFLYMIFFCGFFFFIYLFAKFVEFKKNK